VRGQEAGRYLDPARAAGHVEQNDLTLRRRHALVNPTQAAERATIDSHLSALLEDLPRRRQRAGRQAKNAVAITSLEERGDLLIRTMRGHLAEFDQVENAGGALDRPPPIDDANKKITRKEPAGLPLPADPRPDLRNEDLIAAQDDIFAS
jgi:hypothetical protein